MYRDEVPAYGTLIQLVSDINSQVLQSDRNLKSSLDISDGLDRLSQERHGAIRLGSAAELKTMARIFSVMGMFPVGYYDLAAAGIPVHSTAFRPVSSDALAINPFRMFTSVLRLELIQDESLRELATGIIDSREIFSPSCISLLEKAEADSGLDESDANSFVIAAVETFRWHEQANVSQAIYKDLLGSHRLVADIVSFKGPHINHLTPRTLDIDLAHQTMPQHGIDPKETIEGPPQRDCPILLRQTSFKALEENVNFVDEDSSVSLGSHTARFGEIEQRGIALTPKGRTLYDKLLDKAKGTDSGDYLENLESAFKEFPDNWGELRKQGLAYFQYSVEENNAVPITEENLEDLIDRSVVRFDPIIYEDFLPVSAAGIFQSNLGNDAAQTYAESSSQQDFEIALGKPLRDPFELYEKIQNNSVLAFTE